jgi:hypothetical protein
VPPPLFIARSRRTKNSRPTFGRRLFGVNSIAPPACCSLAARYTALGRGLSRRPHRRAHLFKPVSRSNAFGSTSTPYSFRECRASEGKGEELQHCLAASRVSVRMSNRTRSGRCSLTKS